jgi:hypothetical protein
MATAKKASKKVAIGGVGIDPERAVELALKAFQNQAVREGLSLASETFTRWVRGIRHEHQQRHQNGPVKLPDTEQGEETPDGFMARFGQKGLERRSAGLRDVAKQAFANPTDAGRLELERALDSVDRYLAVVARMPLVKRKPAQWKADNMLDALERGLVEAVAPT